MKIMFSGGGTLGPVAPLLAIFEVYKKYNSQAEFVWVGTKTGPEKELVEHYQIPFLVITSGKVRRYFSLNNFSDIAKIAIGFFESLILLKKEKPSLLITAGGFVSVPLHLAAFVFGIPTWIHQQDVEVGLANRIMSYLATKITTSLEETKKYFLTNKTEWIGNPARDLSIKDINKSREKFAIPAGAPVILAMGGGTGSEKINKLITETLAILPENYHIIHLTGKQLKNELQENLSKTSANYHVYKFLKEDIKDAYALADVVVARAGFSTITELAALGKAAIILPISDTHQEVNAKFFADQEAVMVINEREKNNEKLFRAIVDLIIFPEKRKYLGDRLHAILPPAKPEKIIEIVESLLRWI